MISDIERLDLFNLKENRESIIDYKEVKETYIKIKEYINKSNNKYRRINDTFDIHCSIETIAQVKKMLKEDGIYLKIIKKYSSFFTILLFWGYLNYNKNKFYCNFIRFIFTFDFIFLLIGSIILTYSFISYIFGNQNLIYLLGIFIGIFIIAFPLYIQQYFKKKGFYNL